MAPLIMHAEKTVTIIMHHSRLQRLVTAHHRPKVTVIRVSARRQDWAAQAQDIIQPRLRSGATGQLEKLAGYRRMIQLSLIQA